MGSSVQLQTGEAVARVRADIAEGRVTTAAEAAEMLDHLLPIGAAGVPGGLRYAIARARQQVLAPPFASVDEFSRTISRFEAAADVPPATSTRTLFEAPPDSSRRLEWFAAVTALLCGAFAVGAVAPGLIKRLPYHRAEQRPLETPASPATATSTPAKPSSTPAQSPAEHAVQRPLRHDDEKPAAVATRGTSESIAAPASNDAAAPEAVESSDAAPRTPSRDGARIVYARAEADDPDVWNLWLQPLEGGEAIRLTQYRSGRTGKPSWFPDNHRICYTHETTIAVLDVYGGPPRTFDSPVKGHLVSMPVVSPDGSNVTFQVSQSGTWILDVANGTMQRLLTRD